MIKNPIIYQINCLVWFKEYKNRTGVSSINEIPDSVWMEFKLKGIDIIWLMGVWKTVPASVKKYCFDPGLIKEYDEALPDWKDEDVIGSPYAIDSYSVNPELGSNNDLKKLKKKLNKLGLKLLLDFIPNHFHAESSLIKSHSEIFLPATEELLKKNNHTYYRSELDDNIYCHGRDPYFPAWQDTIQLNYFHTSTHEFMTKELLRLSEFCDGVRCDMAMLALTNIFESTWGNVLTCIDCSKPTEEFWKKAINAVKNKVKSFLFVGEVYWGHEWNLQQVGFDFTYDKTLYDKLLRSNAYSIKEHLKADRTFQQKSLRFIENHDERRAASEFGFEKSKAAAQIISLVIGAKMYFHGQFEGRKTKLPVQLGREPQEKIDEQYSVFYKKLLKITSAEIFKNGTWDLMDNFPSWQDDESYKNILCWSWRDGNDEWLAAINYSTEISSCRIFPDDNAQKEYIQLDDEINDLHFRRNYSDLKRIGLYIELQPYASHLFKVS
jgi:glycosidase